MDIVIPSIIDPFHRAVYSALSETIHNRILFLSTGSVKNFEDYKHQTGYINGLRDALDRCKEIEETMYGSRPGDNLET